MTQAAVAVRNIVARSGFANPIGLDISTDDEDAVYVYADDELLSPGTDYVITSLDPISVTIVGADDVDNYVGYENFTIAFYPTFAQTHDLSGGGRLGVPFEQALGDRMNRMLELPPYIEGPVTTDTPLDGQVPEWDEDNQRFTWVESPAQSGDFAAAAAASAAAAAASEAATLAAESAAATSETNAAASETAAAASAGRACLMGYP